MIQTLHQTPFIPDGPLQFLGHEVKMFWPERSRSDKNPGVNCLSRIPH
jgi:hypothetical protein